MMDGVSDAATMLLKMRIGGRCSQNAREKRERRDVSHGNRGQERLIKQSGPGAAKF